MDHRSPASAWTQRVPLELSRGPLDDDVACDVLVVGTGITGALVARSLVDSDLTVVMIDARTLARGSTSASTALIQYELDLPLVELAERAGEADAVLAYRQSRSALDVLENAIGGAGIDCDLAKRPTLYLARDPRDVPLLQREAAARKRLGIECAFVDPITLRERFGIDRPGAIRSGVSFELDPQKLTVGLLESIVRDGGRIFDRTGLAVGCDVAPGQPLTTSAGGRVTCGHVVFATGYETPAQFPALKELCRMQTTFALVTEPVDESRLWPEKALIWEHAAPYFYARTTPGGGDGKRRVMIGGEDEPLMSAAARDAAIPAKRDALLAQLAELWPALAGAGAEKVWAATFAETADALPFIGALDATGAPDESGRCHFALGYGGNGITFSTIAAGLIRDAVLGRPRTRDARPFRFDRPSARFE